MFRGRNSHGNPPGKLMRRVLTIFRGQSGHAAFASAVPRKTGYQRRKVPSRSPLRTSVRVCSKRKPVPTLSNLDPAPQVVSKESSLFSKFAAPEAVERSSKSFHEMNATARDRECLTEKGLCEHELSSTGWFRESQVRPIQSWLAKATCRRQRRGKFKPSNVSGRLSLLLQDSLRTASRVLAAHAPISI